MALTPPEPNRFMPKMMLTDQQLHNSIEMYARARSGMGGASMPSVGDESKGHAPSYVEFVEDFRRVKLLADFVNAKVDGMTKYVKDSLAPNLAIAYDRLEEEIGFERLSNPKTNYIINGGFRLWNAAVNLPLGWTASGAPTITRTTGRTLPPTTTQGGNFAVTIAAGASAGSISRTFRVKGGSIYRVAGWLNLTASATGTVTLTSDGGTPVVAAFSVTATRVGAGAWFSFPRVNYDELAIQTPADGTTVTVKLEVDANHTCAFSDFQSVQGPNADPDMWEPAPEDIESAPGLGNLDKTLYSTAVQTATGANLNLTTLQTYTLAAGLLVRDGDSIIARAWGSFAANANIKTIAARMGAAATIIATNDITPAPNGTAWSVEFKLTYRNANAQTVIGQAMAGAVAQSVVNTLGNNAMANTLQIGVTGQNGVATASDIVCDGFSVDYHPATP